MTAINSLSDLFRLRVSGLALDQATIATEPGKATVTGRATVLGRPNQPVTVTFQAAAAGQLESDLIIGLPAMTLAEMAEAGYLPPSSYTPADLPAVAFENLQVRLDHAARVVYLTANGPDASALFGIAGLPVRGLTLHLVIKAPEQGAPQNLAAYLTATLEVGAGLPVRIDLPRGLSDWSLRSTNADRVALGQGLSDLAGLAGQPVAPLLPDGLPGLTGFGLSQVALRFNSRAQRLEYVDLVVGTTAPWTIVPPNVLQIIDVTLALQVAREGAAPRVTGRVSGRFALFGVLAEVAIPLPPAAGEWVLTANPNVTIPGMGTLVAQAGSLVGATDLSGYFPPGFADLGAFVVQYLEIRFDPKKRSLSHVAFRLASSESWVMPYASSLFLEEIGVDLAIANPADSAARVVTGSVTGTIMLGSAYVPVRIARPNGESHWTLDITYDDLSVTLADLVELAGIRAEDFTAALPPSLEVLGLIGLTRLSLVYDLTANHLQDVGFAIGLTDPWAIIAPELVVSEASADLQFYDVTAADRLITAALSTTLEIGGVDFRFLGIRPADGQWVLTARMDEQSEFSLNDLINWLLDKLIGGLQLPESFPQVTATGAEVTITPGTGAFHASLTSDIDWEVPFAAKTLAVRDLTTAIAVEPLPEGGEEGHRPYTFTASGDLDFASLQARVAFQTTNAGGDTVLQATLTEAQVAALQPAALADGLLTPGAWSSVPVPADYATPGFSGAGLYLNLTKNTLVLYGALKRLGRGALLVRKVTVAGAEPPAEAWGFAFAIALAPDFRFSHLSEQLRPIDEVLQVESAGLLAASFPATTGTALQESLALVENLPDLARAGALTRGLTFWATLHFTSDLFAAVKQVVSLAGPYTVRALILPDARQSEFEAALGELRILDLIAFKAIALKYTPALADRITLHGTVELGVDETVFAFTGDMLVDRTRASFTLAATDQQLPAPLGMHGLILRHLGAALDVTYAAAEAVETADDKKRRLQAAITGMMDFYSQPEGPDRQPSLTVAGQVLFDGSTPVVAAAMLALDRPLTVGDLLATLVGRNEWPDLGFMEIAFLGGAIYYARFPKGADGQEQPTYTFRGQTYRNGFHMTSAFRLFGRTATVDADIHPNGLVVTGQLDAPLDLGFLQFTDKAFAGASPLVGISTLPQSPATPRSPYFFLQTGVQFLGEQFATADLNVSRDGLKGTLTYTGSLEFARGSSFSFTYDEAHGFQVERWPISLRQIAAFEEKYKEVMGAYQKGGCLPIGSLLFNDVLQTHFALRPSLSGKDGHLVIRLGGRYEISLRGQSPFLYVEMPPLDFTVPQGIRLSNLPEKLGEFLVQNAGAIIQKILDDPAKFTAFMTTVLGKEALEAALDRLICNGRYGAKEAAEAVNGARSAAAAAEAAAASGSAAAAATAAETAATLAAGVGAGLLAAGAAVVAGYAAANAGGGGDEPPVKLPTPGLHALTYNDDREIVASWNGQTAPGGFEVTLLKEGGGRVASQTVRFSLRATFATAGLAPGRYFATVTAQGDGQRFLTSDPATSSQVAILAAPASAALRHVGGRLEVTWAPPSTGAPAGYQVILHCDGREVQRVERAGQSPVTFGPDGLAVGTYTATVRTRGDSTSIGSAPAAASGSVLKPLPPGAVTLAHNLQTRQLQVGWQASAGAPGYEVALVTTAAPHQPVVTRQAAATATSLSVAPADLPDRTAAYQAVLRTAGDERHLPSDPARSAAVLPFLPAPPGLQLSFQPNTERIQLGWLPVPGAAGYHARLVLADQLELTLWEKQYPSDATADLVDPQPFYRAMRSYRFLLQATGDAAHLDSAEAAAPQDLPVLGPASPITVAYDRSSQSLAVTWTPVPDAAAYVVAIVDADHIQQQVHAEGAGRGETVRLIKTAGFARPGGRYRAQVRPLGDARHIHGPFATSQQVATVDPGPATYALRLAEPRSGLAVPPNDAYRFGKGDFTLEAWIKPEGTGTIISRKSTEPGPDRGGFLLVLESPTSFKLATDNGRGFYEVHAAAPNVIDGRWHHVAGIRRGGQLEVYLDSAPLPTRVVSNLPTPLDVNNPLRLLVGFCDQAQEPHNQYKGQIAEVRLFRQARTPSQVRDDMWGVTPLNDPALAGYWNLPDQSPADQSPVRAGGALTGKAQIVTPGAPPLQVRMAGQVEAYYPLEGTAHDWSLRNRHAGGSPAVRFVPDLFGQVADFTQSGAFIGLPVQQFPRYAGAYTLSAWVYLAGTNNIDPAWSSLGTVAGRLSVNREVGALWFWFAYDSPDSADNQGFALASAAALGTGQWHHVAVTYDHGQRALTFYVNGAENMRHDLSRRLAESVRPHLPSGQAIGGFPQLPNQNASTLNGRVSDVLLLNTAATPDMVRFLAERESARTFRTHFVPPGP